MEGKRKPESGTFTQVPNVLLDTCDLPESAQILYLRLLRHFGHRGGTFTGSVRKLSNLVRLSKSTTDRLIKKLRDAGLVNLSYESGADSERDVMTITLNTDELWELNKHHYESMTVPNWDKEMPQCPNLGQTVPDAGQTVPFLGQHVPNLGQHVPNLGQTVPDASSNSTPILLNTSNTLEENEESHLSPEKVSIGTAYLVMRINKFLREIGRYSDKDMIAQQLQQVYMSCQINDPETFYAKIDSAINRTKMTGVDNQQLEYFFYFLSRMLNAS